MKFCPYGGKVSYRSAKEANKVRNYYRQSNGRIRSYQCNRCFEWHLTSEEKVRQLRKPKRRRYDDYDE
jgi:hypothetical protein